MGAGGSWGAGGLTPEGVGGREGSDKGDLEWGRGWGELSWGAEDRVQRSGSENSVVCGGGEGVDGAHPSFSPMPIGAVVSPGAVYGAAASICAPNTNGRVVAAAAHSRSSNGGGGGAAAAAAAAAIFGNGVLGGGRESIGMTAAAAGAAASGVGSGRATAQQHQAPAQQAEQVDFDPFSGLCGTRLGQDDTSSSQPFPSPSYSGQHQIPNANTQQSQRQQQQQVLQEQARGSKGMLNSPPPLKPPPSSGGFDLLS